MFLSPRFISIFFKILFGVDVYEDHDWIVDRLELVQTDLFPSLCVLSVELIEKSVRDIETTFQFQTEEIL